MVFHSKTVAEDQTPTAWRNAGGGKHSRISFRMTTRVIPTSPMFFWAPPWRGLISIFREYRKGSRTNITAYLLTSTGRLRKLELMSAMMSLSSSESPADGSKVLGYPGNSTPYVNS